jgi:hypothetical protein
LFYFDKKTLSENLNSFKKMGYLIKFWMGGEYSTLEDDQMYSDLLDIGVDVIISDHCDKVFRFNESRK